MTASFFSLALCPAVVRTAVGFSLVVGPVLIGINHSDTLLRGEVDGTRLIKMGLTMLVPYVVSTLSSVRAMRDETSVARE
ncbi:MAG: nitrate/nitrite transporter NrtS [Myxococcota bacterium]